MRKEARAILNKWGYNQEGAEEILEVVAELLEVSQEITQREEPYATKSIYEIGLAMEKVRDLSDLFEIDPATQSIMDALDISEEGVEELVSETGLELEELKQLCESEELRSFDEEEEAFNWVHEELDREELLELLYREENRFDEDKAYSIDGKTIYLNN